MAERNQIQKAYWMDQAFPFQMRLDFPFQRDEVGEQVAVGNPYAFGICGRARREDYFDIVVFPDIVDRVRSGGVSGEDRMKLAKIQLGTFQISERPGTRVAHHDLGGDLPLYASDKRPAALKIQRQYVTAAEQP